jgi:hypothetical protein
MNCFRRIFSDGLDFTVRDGQKRSKGIVNGTVLVCTGADDADDDSAKVYAGITSSEVLCCAEMAQKVTAAGKVVVYEGRTMVPIQPKGAVQLKHFQEVRALSVKAGTILTCKRKEGPADIFRHPASIAMVGQVALGEKVVAKEPPEWCLGWNMVPIQPRGAVELELFEIENEVYEDPQNIATWVQVQTQAQAEIQDKMKELKTERVRLMLEEGIRKDKMEKVLQQISVHEAELRGETEPTEAEIKRKADLALERANLATRRTALTAMSFAAPLWLQSQRIFSTFEANIRRTREEGAKMVMNQSKETMKELQCVFGLEDMENLDCHVLEDVNIPSLAALSATVFAPGQLRIIEYVNGLFMVLSVTFVLVDSVVLLVDMTRTCQDTGLAEPPEVADIHAWLQWWVAGLDKRHVYSWFVVDLAVHLFCTTVRVPLHRHVSYVFDQLPSIPQDQIGSDPNPFKGLKKLYDYYTDTGTDALVALDLVLGCNLLYIANWSMLFDTLWLLIGTDIVWETPWETCKTMGIFTLRIRVTLFQIFFAIYIFQLAVFALGQLMQSESFAIKVIQAADKVDDKMRLGFPIVKILCYALCVRQSSDMIAVQLHLQKLERDRIKVEREKAEARVHAATHSFEKGSRGSRSWRQSKLE